MSQLLILSVLFTLNGIITIGESSPQALQDAVVFDYDDTLDPGVKAAIRDTVRAEMANFTANFTVKMQLMIDNSNLELQKMVATALTNSNKRLQTMISTSIANSNKGLQTMIDTSVANSNKGLQTMIDTSVANANKGLQSMIDALVANSNKGLQTMIDTSIANSTKGLKTMIETSIATSNKGLQTMIDTSVANSNRRLQSMIDTSVANSNRGLQALLDTSVGNSAKTILKSIEDHGSVTVYVDPTTECPIYPAPLAGITPDSTVYFLYIAAHRALIDANSKTSDCLGQRLKITFGSNSEMLYSDSTRLKSLPYPVKAGDGIFVWFPT